MDYDVPCENLMASIVRKAMEKRWSKRLWMLMNLGWAPGKRGWGRYSKIWKCQN